MKLAIIKTCLWGILRAFIKLLVAGLDLTTALLELQVVKCRYCLQFGVWPQLQAEKKADEPTEKTTGVYICQADREQAIQQILSCWDKNHNWTIANDRRAFEATRWGQQAIKNNPDRRLYAVLIPNRQENLSRIANVLREMDAEAFTRVSRNAEKLRHSKY